MYENHRYKRRKERQFHSPHHLNIGVLLLSTISGQYHEVMEVWAEECHAFLMPYPHEESSHVYMSNLSILSCGALCYLFSPGTKYYPGSPRRSIPTILVKCEMQRVQVADQGHFCWLILSGRVAVSPTEKRKVTHLSSRVPITQEPGHACHHPTDRARTAKESCGSWAFSVTKAGIPTQMILTLILHFLSFSIKKF